MLQMVPAKKNKIVKGYAAFTDGDWDTVQELLSDDIVWHPMRGHDESSEPEPIVGKEKVIAHLQTLRNTNDVELIGTAVHGPFAIAVDYTHSTDAIGDHGCADLIRFDDSGCIAEFWHCHSGTHDEHHPDGS
jgi:ketosteroid isomerase-like protein